MHVLLAMGHGWDTQSRQSVYDFHKLGGSFLPIMWQLGCCRELHVYFSCTHTLLLRLDVGRKP